MDVLWWQIDGAYWVIQKAIAWAALILIFFGCWLIAARIPSAWPKVLLASFVVWALAAIGIDFYFVHITPDMPFFFSSATYFLFEHRIMISSVAMLVASLSLIMVARTIGSPN